MALAEHGRVEPHPGEGSGRGLGGDELVHQVVVGILEQEGDAAGAAHFAAGRRDQPGGMAQQGRFARAVSPHQRDPLPRCQGH